MWNSSNLIKFAHLRNLANQSALNKVHVIEITQARTVAFMKVRNLLVVWCRDRKETEDGKNLFFKALASFWLTSKNWSWFYKVFHGRAYIK